MIKSFSKASEGKKYSHAEGIRMSTVINHCSRFLEKFKGYNLQYRFIKLDNKNEEKDVEERLLKCYFMRYGEVPPLNHNLPRADIENWNNINCDEYRF